MPRVSRAAVIVEGETYHLIARGNNRMRLFRSREDYEAYLELLDGYARLCGVRIYHYVLMPNHVHLLVRPSEGGLSAFMQAVQCAYAKRYNKREKHVGHVWQGRFKSLIVGSDAYLLACGNYIEMNPVRAKLAAHPGDWPYSSYLTYARGRHDTLVTVDPFYPSLGKTNEERERCYRDLIAKTRAPRT